MTNTPLSTISTILTKSRCAILRIFLASFVLLLPEAKGFSSHPNRSITRISSSSLKPYHYSSLVDTRISGSSNSDNDVFDDLALFWSQRWDSADTLEVRLDATLVSCHTLARFLVYDMTLPVKDLPGFEISDIIALLDTFTSAATLAVVWSLVGLVTRLFEDYANWTRLVLTTGLAAPIWLLLELAFGWPAMESSSTAERILVGTLGLLATMALSRFVPKLLR